MPVVFDGCVGSVDPHPSKIITNFGKSVKPFLTPVRVSLPVIK